jgi:hypothetical protein
MTYQSVTFGVNGQVVDTDLESHVRPANAMSDSQKANVHIATRDGNLQTFNSHSGITEVAPKSTTVQLRASTGLVKVPGMDAEVTPEVLEKMRETSPELFEAPEAAKVAAKEEVKSAAQEAADRADLNRYPDDAAEGVAMHFANDVQFGDQVRVLHELHTTGTISTATLNRVADQLHLSANDTVDAINTIATHSSLQLNAMCNAHGVQDAQAFSAWYKANDPNAFFKSVQVATQDRDIVKAWAAPIATWKARGQR